MRRWQVRWPMDIVEAETAYDAARAALQLSHIGAPVSVEVQSLPITDGDTVWVFQCDKVTQ